MQNHSAAQVFAARLRHTRAMDSDRAYHGQDSWRVISILQLTQQQGFALKRLIDFSRSNSFLKPVWKQT